MTEKPSECDVQDTAFSESAERTTNIMEVCESDAGTPSGSNTNTASIKIKLEETDTADNIKDFDIATVNIKAELPSAGEIDNVQIKQENYGDSESEEEMDIKSEGEDYEDIDDGLLTSKTSMNVTDIDLKDHVKKEIDECEISDEGDFESGINDGVKIEDETVVKYLHSEFDEKFSSCEHSDEDYQSYCTKCRMLVYILDNNVPNNTDDKAIEEIPKDILEIRQSPEHSGIFALKTIPEGVRFGPFMGVNSSDNTWKIKGGKFVVNDENVKFLNWMQHINPAKNILEHNLLAFEHEDNIYYGSMREIQEGEELLVYFGEEYEDSLNNDVEVEFMPHPETNVEDVFACTLCCLGFNSAIHLAKHKTVCPNKTEGSFLNKDIMQCPHCKIYLEQWEYLEHHMTYCREKNYRLCIISASKDQKIVSNESSKEQRKLYKDYLTELQKIDAHDDIEKEETLECFLCKYKTKDKSQLNFHVRTEHFENGKYKCTKCEYETKRKHNVKAHFVKHIELKPFKCPQCDFATRFKHCLTRHIRSHESLKTFKCTKCDVITKTKDSLKRHLVTHDPEKRFKCPNCDYSANQKNSLDIHLTKHEAVKPFTCSECDYTTHSNSSLQRHMFTHETERRFKCPECDYAAKCRRSLTNHIARHKSKQLKCPLCDYSTNQKYSLKIHSYNHETVKPFKCSQCDYATANKLNFREHSNTHNTEKLFKCYHCDYSTNHGRNFRRHANRHSPSVKPLKCSKCKLRYIPSLKAHVCKAPIVNESNKERGGDVIADDVLVGIV